MDPKLPEPLTELLEYVEGIGYGDLYLRTPLPDAASGVLPNVASSAPRPGAGPSRRGSAAAGGQAGTPPTSPPRRPPAERAAPPRPEAAVPTAQSPPSASTAVGALFEGGVPSDVAGRIQALAGIARRAASCQACGLCRGRRSVVFGDGHPDADLMLIGEGPGAQEDRQGLPFVGPAGELLNKIIAAIDETREGVYIANVVKCRPPNNRDPLPDEVDACRAYLEAQIDLVRPKVLVALGRVAAQALLGSRESLGRLRGRWHDVRGVPTRATYHPAALLRNASWKRPTWEDMQLVRDRLRELRSR